MSTRTRGNNPGDDMRVASRHRLVVPTPTTEQEWAAWRERNAAARKVLHRLGAADLLPALGLDTADEEVTA